MDDQPTPQTAKRWRWKRLVWVALVLVLGPYIYSRAASPWNRVQVFDAGLDQQSVNDAIHPGRLRIATYNIAHGRGLAAGNWEGGTTAERKRRLDGIAELLRSENLDVVILNEVDFRSTWSGHVNQAQAIAQAAGYRYWAEQRNLDLQLAYWGARFGNVVLSRFPISEVRAIDFEGYRNWETIVAGKKRGMVCTIELAWNRQIRIVPVHLSHRSETIRLASAKTLKTLFGESEIPLVLAGDFNSSPTGFPHSNSTDSGENSMDYLLSDSTMSVRPRNNPALHEFTFPADAPSQVIDWIVIPSAWSIHEYRVLDSQLSDHRPVVAEIELPERPATGDSQP